MRSLIASLGATLALAVGRSHTDGCPSECLGGAGNVHKRMCDKPICAACSPLLFDKNCGGGHVGSDCADITGWSATNPWDSDGTRTCSYFNGRPEKLCSGWWSQQVGRDGLTAVQACCACKGGGVGNTCEGNPLNCKPNIIVILADDLGYNDVGFNGAKDIPTPHIDSIAKNGVLFKNGYASASICGPSRAGILTGRYQTRFGFETNPTADPENTCTGIPCSEENIAQVLKKSGYTSSVIGKWHMGTHPTNHPLRKGFDHFFGFLHGGMRYFPDELTINDYSDIKKGAWEMYIMLLRRNYRKIKASEWKTKYLTDELSEEATVFIEKNAGNPFALYMSYNAPHEPLQAPQEMIDRVPNSIPQGDPRRIYAAMIMSMDDGVGRILKTLRERGIEDNTMIFFLSDNGGVKTMTKKFASNSPLSEGKSSVHEGGIRVPFAWQWKAGGIPAGKVYHHPVISLDILATIVGVTKTSTKNELDGVNLHPYVQSNPIKQGLPHDFLFWRNRAQRGNQLFQDITRAFAARHGDVKIMIKERSAIPNALYDLRTNIGEKVWENKFDDEDYKEKRDLLMAKWDEWNRENAAYIPFPSYQYDEWWRTDPLNWCKTC